MSKDSHNSPPASAAAPLLVYPRSLGLSAFYVGAASLHPTTGAVLRPAEDLSLLSAHFSVSLTKLKQFCGLSRCLIQEETRRRFENAKVGRVIESEDCCNSSS